ncbi:unnamed protein product [Arctogadus glacialis]
MRNSGAIANQLPVNPLSPGYGNCLLAPATRSQQPPQEAHKEEGGGGGDCLIQFEGDRYQQSTTSTSTTSSPTSSPTSSTSASFCVVAAPGAPQLLKVISQITFHWGAGRSCLSSGGGAGAL